MYTHPYLYLITNWYDSCSGVQIQSHHSINREGIYTSSINVSTVSSALDKMHT